MLRKNEKCRDARRQTAKRFPPPLGNASRSLTPCCLWNWYYVTVTLGSLVRLLLRVQGSSAGAQPYEERNEQPEGILPEPALLCL